MINENIDPEVNKYINNDINDDENAQKEKMFDQCQHK